MENISTTLLKRIKLLWKIVLINGPIELIVTGLVISILFFREMQSLAGVILILALHTQRQDIGFCKQVYARRYHTIIAFEYFLLYIPFCLVAFLFRDPYLIYAPLLYLLLLFLTLYIPYPLHLKKISLPYLRWLCKPSNFEWSYGLRKKSAILVLIIMATVSLSIGTRIIHLYGVMLFFVLLVIEGFYAHPVPPVFAELRALRPRAYIWKTFSIHAKTLAKVLAIPTVIQFFLFYDDLFFIFTYGATGFLVLLLFISNQYYIQANNVARRLYRSINVAGCIAILFPPLSLAIVAYLIYLFQTIRSDYDYPKEFYVNPR